MQLAGFGIARIHALSSFNLSISAIGDLMYDTLKMMIVESEDGDYDSCIV